MLRFIMRAVAILILLILAASSSAPEAASRRSHPHPRAATTLPLPQMPNDTKLQLLADPPLRLGRAIPSSFWSDGELPDELSPDKPLASADKKSLRYGWWDRVFSTTNMAISIPVYFFVMLAGVFVSIYLKRWNILKGLSVFIIAGMLFTIFYLPLHAWRHPHNFRYPYQDLGAWLQGALTPAILLVGLISWWAQRRGTVEQNRILTTSLLLENLRAFYGHLNYTAFCAIIGRRPSAATLPSGNLEGVTRLLRILRTGHADYADLNIPPDLQALPTIDEIRAGDNYDKLIRSVDKTLTLAESANLIELVDERVQQLAYATGVRVV